MKMYLILYLLLPLALTADVINPDSHQTRGSVRSSRRALKRPRTSAAPSSASTESVSRAPFVPRDIIKFELADAKFPDFHPQYQQKHQSQQHKQSSQQQKQQPQPRQQTQQKPRPTRRTRQRKVKPIGQVTSVPIDLDKPEARDLDTDVAASRVMHISHPPPSTYDPSAPRQRVVKELPFGVQKAISHAMKQDINIPYLDTIKYYFKDPTVRTSSPAPPNALKSSFTENRLNKWWQLPSSLKSSSSPLTAVSTSYAYSTTPKSVSTAEVPSADYATYPLLRAYPVQYSMNVGQNLVDGVGFLYGDRIYTKIPYSYGKVSDQPSNSLFTKVSVKPLDTPAAVLSENVPEEFATITPNGLSSTSPIQFPVNADDLAPTKPPPQKSFVKYYAAVSADDTGVPLSADKNTLNLINKAVNAIKKHNPHLDVIPTKVENDELIVHVTPKPEFFKASDATKTFTSSKNLAYIAQKLVENDKPSGGPVFNKQKTTKTVNHHYLQQIHAVAPGNGNNGDLFKSGYAFGYRVRDHITGNDFGHHQKQMVDGTTHGEYKILMPDGRTQSVRYKADDHGYHADVSYEE